MLFCKYNGVTKKFQRKNKQLAPIECLMTDFDLCFACLSCLFRQSEENQKKIFIKRGTKKTTFCENN